MVDVLFGQSYFLRFDPKLFEAMQPYPPLGTLYAASYMRILGYKVMLFDAMLAESELEWAEALEKYAPQFAVIFEDNFNYLSKMCLTRMRQAAFKMIEFAKWQDCTVILCGADATDNPDLYLSHGADFVLIGEGEHTLGELVDHLTGRTVKPLEDIHGIAWLNGENSTVTGSHTLINKQITLPEINQNPRRQEIQNLDDLPFPAWDLVDIPHYKDTWIRHHGYFSMNIATTRGCPYHCNWCAKPIWGQRYHARSPENVVAEISLLKMRYKPDQIWFVDDIFGLKPGWIERFATTIHASQAQIPFKCLSRVDLLLRPGEIEALAKAGCQIVWVGAESGSQKILDAMEKGTRVEQIYLATQRLRQAGIQVGYFLQFGYPGETRAEIEKTLKLVRDCLPDDIGMSVSYPLPGTKFHAAVKSQLGSKQNWVDSNDLAILFKSPFTTAFYRQLHTVLHKEFRLRKAWQFIYREVRRPDMVSTITGKPPRNSQKAMKTIIKNILTLPWERWKLNQLEKKPHEGTVLDLQGLDPAEAAQPSPQIEN